MTSGAQQGIDLVARTFVGPGDVVYMEAPTYTGAIDVFTSRGAKVVMIPMDEQGMRMQLLDLAQSYHCLIVEDDPFSDLYYKTKPPLPIKAHGHVIYIKSFSKTVAPGCRIACVVATGSVLNRFCGSQVNYGPGKPSADAKSTVTFHQASAGQPSCLVKGSNAGPSDHCFAHTPALCPRRGHLASA